MNSLVNFLGQALINAIGWSLFHILWQGLILAICLGVLLRILRHKSAKIRYAITLLSLFIITGLSVMNFIQHVDQKHYRYQNTTITDSNNNKLLVIDLNDSNTNLDYTSLYHNIKSMISRIDRYFPFIINLWILGVIFFTIKFMFSFLYTNRLKHKKTRFVSEKWIKSFNNLENKIGIKKTINYIESYIIKIPMVLGHLKPVVLIPAEMLTGIPSDQIEAIIAHELAHIKRNDYIINVLQTIIETVFFFHPAVWYISAQLRKERENCCDDMALTICSESIVYAKALVSIQELTLNRHYSAVAFSGNKKHLLNRIKRLIMKPKVKSNITDKIIAALIILSGIVALSFTCHDKMPGPSFEGDILNNNLVPKIEKTEISVPVEPPRPAIPPLPSELEEIAPPELIAVKDTVKKYKSDYIDIDGHTVTRRERKNGKQKKLKFTLENGNVTELYIDGNKIPESDYYKYQPEIDETINDLKDAKVDIRKAMEDIKNLDIEKIQLEVQEAMKDVHMDVAEIQEEIARAMEETHAIDVEDILKEVEMNITNLNDIDIDFDFDDDFDIEIGDIHIDMEEIQEKMERARKSIKENVDKEAIEKEILKAQEELSKIDKEKIRMQIEEDIKSFEKYDKNKVMKDLEEKLEELETLELEAI